MERLVNIIITTYDSGTGERLSLLKQTVGALIDNLRYDNLHYIITDDSIPEVHIQTIKQIEPQLIDNACLYTFINTNRRGVGYAKNNALRVAFETSPVVLLMEDDWILKEPLTLLPHVQVLEDNDNVGMIRFGFLGGQMKATLTDYGYPKTYWTLQHKSGHYVYSGQVSLRHQRFYKAVGLHVEQQENNKPVEAGREEDEMCHRYNNTTNPPDILWSCQYGSMLNCGPFINIGMGNSTNAVQP
jgi:hypothetical protein